MKTSGIKRVRQSYMQYRLTQAKENSDYGIDGGRITKLILNDPENNILCKYDKAWKQWPAEYDVKMILMFLKKDYN